MNLTETKQAHQHALEMVKRYKEESEKLAERIVQMSVCEHEWNRDIKFMAELEGRDLGYYDAECRKCGILKSETF